MNDAVRNTAVLLRMFKSSNITGDWLETLKD